VTVSCITT